MTLVKKKDSAMVKLVEDSRVPALLREGFELLEAPKAPGKPTPKKGGRADAKDSG